MNPSIRNAQRFEPRLHSGETMTAIAGTVFGLFTFLSGGALPNPVYNAMSECHKRGGEYSVTTGCVVRQPSTTSRQP